MKNHNFVRQWQIMLVVTLFFGTQLLSFADVINPGMLTISAPGLFTAPQASSWGKASVSLYSTARSTRNNLPLQKLEDAKALDSAGVHTRKDFAIAPDGIVDCIVSHPATHEPLGFFELARADGWASPFLREQDAADVKTVQATVRGWSNNVRAAFDECDLVYVGHVAERNARFPSNAGIFYEQEFAPSAMYHMALREIAPSKALYALHHGREERSNLCTIRNLWEIRRYRDLETNTQVLTWRSSLGKTVIVAIAHAANDHVEPVPGQQGLLFYGKNKHLRKQFYAQEKEDGESKEVETEKSAEEMTKAPVPEPPEPEDPEEPDDPDDEEAIDRVCEKIDEDRKDHIFQEHHYWERLVENPKENWDKVIKIIKEVMKKGNETFRGKHRDFDGYERSLKVKNEVVKVRFVKQNGIIRSISNAMVAPK